MAYYFPKLANVYANGVTRVLDQGVAGGGFRPTINGMTMSWWMCSAGGVSLSLNANAQPFGFVSLVGSATGYNADSDICLAQAVVNGGYIGGVHGGQVWSTGTQPTFNVTPGDGYNYKSPLVHIMIAVNFLTGVVQVYNNDVLSHVISPGGSFSALNNSALTWNIQMSGNVRAAVGDLWILDEYIDIGFTPNRRQFINANKSGVSLPSDGHVTFSNGRRTPVHFFRIQSSSSTATDFLTNNGSSTLPWNLSPASPTVTLDTCVTTTFVGIVVPPPPLPIPPALVTKPWTIEPDWAEGVTERLQWKTDVISSQLGYEQRRRLRNGPRRQIEAAFTLIGTDRRLYDAYMEGAGSGRWIYPLWWERLSTIGTAVIGDDILSCDTRYTEIAEGSVVMLIGASPFIYEAVEVTSVGTFDITLATPLTRNWPAGSKLYLTKICFISNMQAGTRQADDAYQVTLTFESDELNDFSPFAPTTTYDSVPVLNLFPDEATDMTTTYNRLMADFDNDTGLGRARLDLSGRAFVAQQFNYFMQGKAELNLVRRLLYFLQGKLVPIYVPTFFRDVEIIPQYIAVVGDLTLRVRRSGYAEFISPTLPDRNLLLIVNRDGTQRIMQVSQAFVVNDEEELLVFTQPLDHAVSFLNTLRACFISLSRQDQDDIEIMHPVDAAGVTTMTTTFISITPGRVDTAYNAVVFNGSYTQDNNPIPAPVDAQNQDQTLVLGGTSYYGSLQDAFAETTTFGPIVQGG